MVDAGQLGASSEAVGQNTYLWLLGCLEAQWLGSKQQEVSKVSKDTCSFKAWTQQLAQMCSERCHILLVQESQGPDSRGETRLSKNFRVTFKAVCIH